MAIDTIKSTAVLDGAIATADIADDAVTGDKIANDAVTGDKLSNDVAIANNLTLGGDRIGIGTSTVSTAIGGGVEVHRANGSSFRIEDTTNSVVGELQVYNNGVNLVAQTNHPIIISPNNAEIARFTTAGLHIGGTGSANALDDYEEGTFTPAYTSGITGSYTTQTGTYTKIGRLVYVEIHIDGNSMSGDSNQVKIGGLPFATQNSTASNGGAYHVYTGGTYNGGNDVTWLFARNESVVYAYNVSGATFRGNQWSDVNGGYRIAGFYQAA